MCFAGVCFRRMVRRVAIPLARDEFERAYSVLLPLAGVVA